MMRDIDQQVRLDETLDSRISRNSRDDLQCRRCNVHARNENASVVAAGNEMLGKCAHLLDTDTGIWEKFDPNRADIWRWGVWIGGCGWVGVSLHHIIAGTGGEGHDLAA